jgi:putative protein kinase ArgK-like GTPase of G3E family
MAKKTVSPKYIFVVGGVISGVGKGVTASSIAKILKDKGHRVTSIKIDPYVNEENGAAAGRADRRAPARREGHARLRGEPDFMNQEKIDLLE